MSLSPISPLISHPNPLFPARGSFAPKVIWICAQSDTPPPQGYNCAQNELLLRQKRRKWEKIAPEVSSPPHRIKQVHTSISCFWQSVASDCTHPISVFGRLRINVFQSGVERLCFPPLARSVSFRQLGCQQMVQRICGSARLNHIYFGTSESVGL